MHKAFLKSQIEVNVISRVTAHASLTRNACLIKNPQPKEDYQPDKVTAAKMTNIYSCKQHLQSHKSADSGIKLGPGIFLDSEIGNTKTNKTTKNNPVV